MTSKAAVQRLGFVLLLLVILIVLAIPPIRRSLVRYRESMLKNELYALRVTIDEYTFDKKCPPQRLEDLIQAGYLREIPIDPMTASERTWGVTIKTWGHSNMRGIYDVYSGSGAKSLDGTPYSEW